MTSFPAPVQERLGRRTRLRSRGRSPRLQALKTMLEIVEYIRTERGWHSTQAIGARFHLGARQTLRYMRCIEEALPVAVEKEKRHQGDCLWPCYWRWVGRR